MTIGELELKWRIAILDWYLEIHGTALKHLDLSELAWDKHLMKLALICDNLIELIVHPLDVSEHLLKQPSRILPRVLLEGNLILHLFILIKLIDMVYDLFAMCVLRIHMIGQITLDRDLAHMMLQFTLDVN